MALQVFLSEEAKLYGYEEGAVRYYIEAEDEADNFEIALSDEVEVTTKKGKTIVNSFKEFATLHEEWQDS